MQHLVNSSGAEKRALRDAIEHEVQQFLEQGGTITVLNGPPVDADHYGGCLWHDGDDDSIVSD